MMNRRSGILAIAATSVAMSPLVAAGPASGDADDTARAGVCAGVKNCHRVAVVDISGDRRADHVGWQQIDRNRVRIRVRVTAGPLVTRKVNVRQWWRGGEWGGAAWIDGRRGAEMLVGSTMGAHTPFYTMLTYRNRRLVVEKSPAVGAYGSNRWAIDASLMAYAGWDRNVGRNGRLTMTQRVARRNDKSNGFSGHNVRYVWRNGDWRRVKRTERTYKNERQARKIAGWHVGHLQRFPGI